MPDSEKGGRKSGRPPKDNYDINKIKDALNQMQIIDGKKVKQKSLRRVCIDLGYDPVLGPRWVRYNYDHIEHTHHHFLPKDKGKNAS